MQIIAGNNLVTATINNKASHLCRATTSQARKSTAEIPYHLFANCHLNLTAQRHT